jgi:hypothetical protein
VTNSDWMRNSRHLVAAKLPIEKDDDEVQKYLRGN